MPYHDKDGKNNNIHLQGFLNIVQHWASHLATTTVIMQQWKPKNKYNATAAKTTKVTKNYSNNNNNKQITQRRPEQPTLNNDNRLE